MIIISSRKDFSNPDQLSETGHLIREVDLANDTVTAVLDFRTCCTWSRASACSCWYTATTTSSTRCSTPTR